MSQNLHKHNFRTNSLPKKMRETTNKYKLPVYFSKAKLACYPFSTIFYSNIFTFLQIFPHLLQLKYKGDLKIQSPWKFTRKMQTFHKRCLWCSWYLECLHLMNFSSACLLSIPVHYSVRVYYYDKINHYLKQLLLSQKTVHWLREAVVRIVYGITH